MGEKQIKEIGFDEAFKILAKHFFGAFSKVITHYEIIKLPKKADVLVIEEEKPFKQYVKIFDYFKKFNIIEFKSVNDPFRIDKDIPKMLVYIGGILLNEKKATLENTTFTILSSRKPKRFLREYKKHVHILKKGVYLLMNIVQVPIYVIIPNEVKGEIDRELSLIKEFSTGNERVRFIETVLHDVLKGGLDLKEYLHFAFSLYRDETHDIIQKEGVSMTIVEKNIREWADELGLKDTYKKEGKIEDAIKMKEEGFDNTLIAKITNLSLETIENL